MKTIGKAKQLFKSKFRTEKDIRQGEPRLIGLENEYVMVYADGSIIRQEVLECLWIELAHQGWELVLDKITGKPTAALRPRRDQALRRTHNFDVITTDFGYSTLEIDLAPARTLREATESLIDLIHLVTSILAKHDVHLLGYGVQPLAGPSREYLGPKNRYALLYDVHLLEHRGIPSLDLHCLTASCQTQVEVSTKEAISAVNSLNATAGLRSALFANSPVWQNRISEYKSIRQEFWDRCYPNRKLQIGIPPRFQNFEHYVDYICDFRSIVVGRDEIFYRINNNSAFRNFLDDNLGQIGIALDGHKSKIIALAEDIYTQHGFAWFDSRLHPLHGTVEDRVSCQQPPQAHFSSAAMTLGLVENLNALVRIANALSLDQWREIRQLSYTYGLHFSYPGVDLKELSNCLLQVALEGLRRRGFGEEEYLEPVCRRIMSGSCPADEVVSQFLEGGVQNIVANNDMRNLLLSTRR